MKYSIANFGQLRYFKPNQIPISTAMYQPKFWKFGMDKHNVFLGITAPELSPAGIQEHVLCGKPCKYKQAVMTNSCPFLRSYLNYLLTLDFKKLLADFSKVAEDVRKISLFTGEPEIVLLVYEAVDNPCSERFALQQLFSINGLTLANYTATANSLNLGGF